MKKFILPVSLMLLGGLIYFISVKNISKPLKELPVYGNEGHVVKNFSLISHENKKISLADLNEKVFVVEYFFTSCKSICPIMNDNMMMVDSAFKEYEHMKILSFTVDPETDTVAALNEYAKLHHASNNWIFLTGDKQLLYNLARESFMLDAEENATKDIGEDFIHTKNFALLDKQKHIRGYYDGTNKDEILKLIDDAKILLSEKK